MNRYFVYFNTSNKRLTITINREVGESFIELMNTEGNNNMSVPMCKMFCIGYMMGNNSIYKATNDINEFK